MQNLMRAAQIFASACDAAARQEPANSRACKYALNTLMNIFRSPALGQANQASSSVLQVRDTRENLLVRPGPAIRNSPPLLGGENVPPGQILPNLSTHSRKRPDSRSDL
ncbi:hypothetical protein DUNSADRAFT_18025 [Dunaliella salina]|uniref:Encoded protein n=1 Tax=Dunaliella salina TaxID=3046 RepID=A0ABQ7G0T6_DUNSA|nr:hypothetical protein DUNSADRAFT_18025 [Dunaliella salina]|eukprot:KAF5828200.1 hypothetical protein DUNSADRAFT_18025 [Dunaliella salina]